MPPTEVPDVRTTPKNSPNWKFLEVIITFSVLAKKAVNIAPVIFIEPDTVCCCAAGRSNVSVKEGFEPAAEINLREMGDELKDKVNWKLRVISEALRIASPVT